MQVVSSQIRSRIAPFQGHGAGQTFAFVAVILDCADDRAKAFYQRWDFQELPGRPMRLFLSFAYLEKLVSSTDE